MENQDNKEHPWIPGTLIQLQAEQKGFIPLFKKPISGSIKTIAPGEFVIYLDCWNELPNPLMIKIIHGEDIGWTYGMCARSIE